MKIGVLGVGQVAPEVLAAASRGLAEVFPDTTSSALEHNMAIPVHVFDRRRKQFNSSLILPHVGSYAANRQDLHRILGVIDADIYAIGLNYVFGEAYTPGKAGLISLWRLRPQFYGEEADSGTFLQRVVKEAVHEIGHTLGLQHCPRSYCVMHFANSIFDVDKKQNFFCDQCYLNAAVAITRIG